MPSQTHLLIHSLLPTFLPYPPFPCVPVHASSIVHRLSLLSTSPRPLTTHSATCAFVLLIVLLFALHSQPPADSRMEPVYPRHNNEYDPSAQAVPSQAGINPISPVNGTQRTGTPTMPMDSRMSQQQPMQFSNPNGGQQAIGVGNGNGEFEEPRRNKFLDILCCRMH